MAMPTSLLIATDFSDSARHAAYRAAMLAAEQHARLHALHVMSRSSLDALRELLRSHPGAEATLVDDVRSMLSETAAQIGTQTGVTVDPRVEIGDVLDEILSASEEADMLILGARGAHPVRALFLGTTAERLLLKCKRPVLVVKQPPNGAYGKVLVPVDLSAHSIEALQLAVRVAPAASITVAHAFDVPFEGKLRLADVSLDEIERYRGRMREQALNGIRALIQRLGGDARRCTAVIERGDPRRWILDQEEALRADLIVIGKQGSAMEDRLIGSVTRHVLSGAHCDVLVETSGVGKRYSKASY
jgi:nucleotide-binding universal stress UspA family protein